MTHFLNHIFQIQIMLYVFVLASFWLLEFLICSQYLKPKIAHTLLNAKFLFMVVPIQLLMSILVLCVSNYIETEKIGFLFLFPITPNSFIFFIVAFVILDFFDYLYHFMMHKTPLFWKFHQIHHSDLEVDISTTIREHPGETFIRVSYSVLVIIVVGAAPWVLIFKQLIQSFSNITAHSKIKLPKTLNNIVSKVFVTPNTHSIHHHYLLPYTDSNFGDVLSIWDHLFSTFSILEQSEIICGVDTNMIEKENKSFKKLLKRPFVLIKEKIWESRKKKQQNIILFTALITSSVIHSQTIVKGILVDTQNVPISNANIIFKGSNNGTLTNHLGVFILKSDKTYKEICIKYVGFEEKNILLDAQNTTDLKIVLNEQINTLNEVAIISEPRKRIKKKDNPAYKILENIWKNKNKNGLKNSKSYQYDQYSSTEFGFNNFDSTAVKKILKKDFDAISLQMKKNEEDTYLVPIELFEKNQTIFGNNILNKEKTIIDGERYTGVEQQPDLFRNITNTFQKIDVYENNIILLNKNFVSPLSTEGFGTYNYVLSDSTFIGDKKYYTIKFYPRESRDFAFRGHFIVDTKSYSLTEIAMESPKKMNLNFVKNFEIKKTFLIENDIYLPLINEYKGTFTILTKDDDRKGAYLVKKEMFSNYILENPKEDQFYDQNDTQTSFTQYKKTSAYWDQKQDEEVKNTYKTVSITKDSKPIKSITETVYILTDGYIPLSKGFQTGNIWATAAQNEIEGLRLRAGFRTFISDNDRLKIEGFTAYGTKDKTIKYGLETRYLLSNNPRTTISAAYLNDYEQMGLIQFNSIHLLPEADKGSKAFFVRGHNYYLSHIQKIMLRYDFEPIKNVHTGITLSHNSIKSAAPNLFSLDYYDTKTGEINSTTTDVTSDVYITYTPGKEVSGFGVDEKNGIKLHSKIMFNYRRGYKDVLGGSFNYNRIQVLYNNPISLGKFGIFNATIDAGKTFEPTPLSILTAVSANQTYFLVPNTFALLDYYDFVADTYIEGHFEHHFNGFLMNKIPIVKKLNWRSVLTFRAVYGTISEGSKAINRSSIVYNAPTQLYYEYGFGFENIGYGNIRPFRLDFIWRGDLPNIKTPINPKFGIRIGLKTSF